MVLVYNCIIIGGGPAGFTAGIYLGRAGIEPLILTGPQPGGQLTTTTEIENFPGFESISGFELMEKFQRQAESYKVSIQDETVLSLANNEKLFIVKTDQKNYLSKTIIVASGATAKRLNLPGESKLWNKGISACAVCDGALPIFKGKPVAVVGGGDTACEEALFMSKFASKVYLIHRGKSLRASKILEDRVRKNEKVEILFNTIVLDVEGEGKVEKVRLENGEGKSEIPVSGLFYGIGHTPNTSFFIRISGYSGSGVY